ncbi:MAG: short-chain dehydrogenase/reductase [Proteobacteria bacterium]|nr:short-chain dehydrogenase/reductase [Pseudomonadota bacterium]
MELKLNGKSALITGASKGIGRAIAECLAAEGCHLHLCSRSENDLKSAAEAITAAHDVTVMTHAHDLSKAEEIAALAGAVGNVDILINNAGAIPAGRLLELDEETWDNGMALKLHGYIRLTRHIYRAMTERGSGVILNIIGSAARNPGPTRIGTSTANAALEAFTIALGKESPSHGIRVLGLHPGGTRTERQEAQWRRRAEAEYGDADRWRDIMPNYPFGRPAEAVEVGEMAAFLVSEKSGYSSGVVMEFSGGL